MTTEQREPLYASTAKPWLKYYDQKYIDMPLPKCSAFEYLCHQNKNHLSETALEYYGRKFTFADLFVNVKKTAAAFRALGVKKGDIITVVSVMTPEVIYAFYAVDMIGATLNLVDPRYSVEGIHEYIEEVDSRLLICLNVTYERCHKAEKRTNVERVLVISPADSLPLHLAVGYKLTNPDKNRYKSNVLHRKDFIAQGKDQSMNAEPSDPQPLCMGLHVCITPYLAPDMLGTLIRPHQPAHMFGVPAHYQQMAASPLLKKKKDLSFIRNYAAGGDSLPLGAELTVNEFLKAHNVEYPLAKGYGMTEVASAATVAAGNVTKPGSVGIPMLNTVVSIFEPGTETELPIGERGEICICTPTVMKGYYNKPEETDMILRRHADGQIWAHTGDVGYMDEDGFVYLDSRIKRMIIRHDGFKVFPSMIENVISRHPAVHQCSVVGCTDKDHVQGRLPFVYVVLDPEGDKKKRQIVRELRQLCNEELPEYVQPVGNKFNSEMPYTPVGKVDYRKLEEEITPRDY